LVLLQEKASVGPDPLKEILQTFLELQNNLVCSVHNSQAVDLKFVRNDFVPFPSFEEI
jgi:hypothetical protein